MHGDESFLAAAAIDETGNLDVAGGDHADADALGRESFKHDGGDAGVMTHPGADARHLGDIRALLHGACSDFSDRLFGGGERFGHVNLRNRERNLC